MLRDKQHNTVRKLRKIKKQNSSEKIYNSILLWHLHNLQYSHILLCMTTRGLVLSLTFILLSCSMIQLLKKKFNLPMPPPKKNQKKPQKTKRQSGRGLIFSCPQTINEKKSSHHWEERWGKRLCDVCLVSKTYL